MLPLISVDCTDPFWIVVFDATISTIGVGGRGSSCFCEAESVGGLGPGFTGLAVFWPFNMNEGLLGMGGGSSSVVGPLSCRNS